MKISIVINGWTTKMSGGDYHILKVANYWGRVHKNFYILPLLGYKYSKKFLMGKFFVFHTPFEKETTNLLTIIAMYFSRIIKILLYHTNEKFDIVIAPAHFLYDVIPAVVMKKRNQSKLVVYVHHLIINMNRKMNIRNVISSLNEKISLMLVKRFADTIFVVNSMTRKDLVKRGFPNEKIFITNNGLDHEFIGRVRSGPKKYDACFCGRLVAQKGIFDLITIWENVLEVLPDAKLLIIGDGNDSSALKAEIEKHKLEKNIMLLGHVSEEAKIKTLKSSKVFIFPSYEEGWGIAIAEAMSCGLPVVAYHLPVYDEVFGNNVIEAPIKDIKKMSDSTISLLNNRALRDNLGKKGKIFVKKYNWKKVAKKELKVIINDKW